VALPNRVALTLSAIFGGAAAGAAVATFGVWLANWMNLNGKTTFGDPRNVFVAGMVLGIVTTLALAWSMSSSLLETWRRAAIAVTASFGTFAAGMGAYFLSILTIMMMTPAAQAILPGMFVLCVIIAFACFRVSQRHRGSAPARAA
jgi:hypothetical protein